MGGLGGSALHYRVGALGPAARLPRHLFQGGQTTPARLSVDQELASGHDHQEIQRPDVDMEGCLSESNLVEKDAAC